jgi:hypothetical protein
VLSCQAAEGDGCRKRAPRGLRTRLSQTADRRLDAGPQPGRRFLARQPFMNQPLQCLDAFAFGGERRVRAHLLRDPQRIGGIELAVEIGMNQQHRVIVSR